MTENTKRIIAEILKVARGEVSSYRDIAIRAGIPNGARQVARVLHSMTAKYDLPWHRIVKSDGWIALEGAGKEEQIRLLRSEGIVVSKDGKVMNMSV
jgi:methylated-DNA-protein-cysteine methyltransferase-like protein